MFRWLQFLLLFYVAESEASHGKGLFDVLFSPCRCRCGVPNREDRLLGGEHLKNYEFPWISQIHIEKGQSISGTLINNKYVITAASQITGLTPYDVKVTLGQFDRCFPDVTSTNFSVEKLIFHPDFSPGNKAHDLALIKLAAPVQIERRISPVCLAIPGNSYVGQVATLVGWSDSNSDQEKSSCQPKKLGLPVLEHKQCFGANNDSELFTKDKSCAGVIGTPNVACKYDGGGPVLYRSYGGVYELIGILSDRNECNHESNPALFTRITEHLNWITQNTRDACYCIKL